MRIKVRPGVEGGGSHSCKENKRKGRAIVSV